MRKFFTHEVKIAITAILALVLLFFGLRYLKGMNLFGTDKCYYVKTNAISGLSIASPVYVNGYKVGSVKDIDFNYKNGDDIVLALDLDKDLCVPFGSVAYVVPSMLGGTTVELHLGEGGRICQPGDTILGGVDSGIMSKAAGMLPAIENMMPKLDSILARVNILLADPAVDASLHNVENITSQLTTSTQELNKMMTEVNKNLPALMSNANSAMGNVSNLTDNLNKTVENMDLDNMMANLQTTLDNVKLLTNKLNSKDGTIGALVNDRALYDNLNTSLSSLNTTLTSTNALMEDLKAHPKRYVHFSVFGKKDK